MSTTMSAAADATTEAYVFYCAEPGCGKVRSCGVGKPGTSDEGLRCEIMTAEQMRKSGFCRCKPKKKDGAR